MNTETGWLALVFAAVSIVGIRSTWRLWRIWRFDQRSRQSLILAAFAIVSLLITIGALWFGILTVRRLLGFESLPELQLGSFIIVVIILLIPAGLERVVARIGSTRLSETTDEEEAVNGRSKADQESDSR